MKHGFEGLSVFDADGVINQGAKAWYDESYLQMSADMGLDLSDDEIIRRVYEKWGSDAEIIVGNILREYKEDAYAYYALIAEGVELFRSHQLISLKDKITKVKGANEALERLSSRYLLAINSAADKEILVNHMLPALDIDPAIFRGEIKTADELEAEEAKPSPAVILKLMDKYGIGADSTVMVGDSVTDMESARNAGVEPIAVTKTGNLDVGQARELGYVHYIVEDVVQAAEIIPDVIAYRKKLGNIGIGNVNWRPVSLKA